jgi:NDP-sugar pyrophosphorylase family protein
MTAGTALSAITTAILAGGLGTRLRSVVSDRPKVLAEVNGRPFLAYLLDQLTAAGVRRTVLCTGYLGEMVEQVFGDSFGAMQLLYSRETQPLGTGGALREALPKLHSSTVLVLNGDSLCEVDLPAFVETHVASHAAVSLVLTRVDDTSRYGRVETEADGRVRSFVEKAESQGPGWINAGVYLIERSMLQSLPAGVDISLERTVFPSLIGRGLYGNCCGGRFIDVGQPESYHAAREFMQSIQLAQLQ